MTLREFCIREKSNVNSETKDYNYIDVRFATNENADNVSFFGAENVEVLLRVCDNETLNSIITDIDHWGAEGLYVIDVMPRAFAKLYGYREIKV